MNSHRNNQRLSPSVNYITKTIADRIRLGEYQAGRWLPTERNLAAEFEVSRATVRRALERLAQANLLICEEGCRPLVNSIYSEEIFTARRSVSLWITSNPLDVGAYSALCGVRQKLDADAFRLVLESPSVRTLQQTIEEEARFLERAAADPDIAGVILWYFGGEQNLPGLHALRAAGKEMVFIDRRPPAGFDADFAGIDNEEAAFEAVQFLISRGHRNIAHITNPETACTVTERLAGYRRALETAGIAYRPEMVLKSDFMEGDLEAEHAAQERLVGRLLALPQLPDAVFALNDHAALALNTHLRERGVRVPEDMSLVGFDDLERWSPGKASLTTVRQPFERIGARAARLLQERLTSSPEAPFQHHILETSLIVRQSTGCTVKQLSRMIDSTGLKQTDEEM